MRSRSDAFDAEDLLVQRLELVARDGELVQRRRRFLVAPRRRPSARGTRACRCSRPRASARRSSTSLRAGASSSTIRSCRARRSRFESGSECTSSAVRRATPSGRLVAHCIPRCVADHHLEAPAAEVEAHARARGRAPPTARIALEDQARLLVAADDLDVDAGLVLDAVDELGAVRGAADRARRLGERLDRVRRRRRAGGTGAPWRRPGRRPRAGSNP